MIIPDCNPSWLRSRMLRLCALLVVCACGSTQKPTVEHAKASAPAPQLTRRAETPTPTASATGDRCSPVPIHFAYDSADLDPQARQELVADADCVKHASGEVNVTGMTDPRGTEEYNLALGEKRAESVTTYLSNLGVDRHRLEAHSLGEEYAKGSNDTGWREDRRAELSLH